MLFRKTAVTATETEIIAIRERTRRVREQIGRRDVKLADLFGLVGEDERYFARPRIEDEAEPELRRYRPDEV